MHPIKSILMHLDGTARCAERIRVARQLGETFDAEVVGLYAVTPALWRYPIVAEGGSMVTAELAQIDAECRDRAKAVFDAASAGAPRMRWGELTADAPWGFARRAFYSDLMLFGQRDPADPAAFETPADFLSSMLIESGRPALLLPYTGKIAPIGGTVLVAWKPTREAARAVTAALPWLRAAAKVHVVVYGDDADESLKAVARHLQTHGVSATTHRGGPELGNAGESVLSQAADLGADLLVMGCYGHSRAREWVLGGATRTILQSMTLPVLMAH